MKAASKSTCSIENVCFLCSYRYRSYICALGLATNRTSVTFATHANGSRRSLCKNGQNGIFPICDFLMTLWLVGGLLKLMMCFTFISGGNGAGQADGTDRCGGALGPGSGSAEGKWADWKWTREVEGRVLFTEENCFDQPSLAEYHLSHPS